MTRKDIKKLFGLILAGWGTAIVLYPFLHETGHSLITLLVGGEVVEFHLFPLPNILCLLREQNTAEVVLIGLSGMLFPFVISCLPSCKNFWLWYVNWSLKGISLLSFLISAVVVIMFQCGTPVENDDMTRVMETYPQGATMYLALFALLSVYVIWRMVEDRPINRLLSLFELQKKGELENVRTLEKDRDRLAKNQ